MPTALIIGSGPSAAGAALALSRRADLDITIIDLGLELESTRRSLVDQLAAVSPNAWDASSLQEITAQPVDASVRGLPEKRAYGSDFAFRDVGQLDHVTPTRDVNGALISAAYGGFSNVWGSQVMPFTRATFDTWPVSWPAIESHYRAVLDEIPFAAEADDLSELFPLLTTSSALPPPAERTALVLQRYERRRARLRALGVTVGKARLAFESSECVRCGLCMTGCPYSLIYSSRTTFDRLRANGRVTYHADLMAVRVGEDDDGAFVWAKEKTTGRMKRFGADRVYVACGAMGSTRLVVNSLGLFDEKISLHESAQFAVPFVSRAPTTDDPRSEAQFTLNQFNMLVSPGGNDVDLALLHFYTYNPAFEAAVPNFLRAQWAGASLTHLLRRLSVALGYLPSWASPKLRARVRPAEHDDDLPALTLSRDEVHWRENAMLRAVIARVVRAGRHLDLWPVLPSMILSAGAKSYHFGGSFPHEVSPSSAMASDELGRVAPWRRIHMVDAAVFPSVPATTFTLTIMANAHRIATQSQKLA